MQCILDVKALYSDSSLIDLYDGLTMPPELSRAHKENDKVLLKAYGLKSDISEEEIIAFLMKRYLEVTKHDG